MENETEKIFSEQLGKLPQEVVTFISSTNWDTDLDEIGELYNLSKEEVLGFKREVTLILAGLVHPDALTQMLDQEVGIKGAVLEALVANVEKKIFSTVRPSLIAFFEKEEAENIETTPLTPSIPPDNLPTVETTDPFLPPLVPKVIRETPTPVVEPEAHPFEEKMKGVFTAGKQTMDEFVINTPAPQPQKSAFPPISDPYREPIE